MKQGEQHVWHVTGFDRWLNWHSMYFLSYQDAAGYFGQLSRFWRKLYPVVVVNYSLILPK